MSDTLDFDLPKHRSSVIKVIGVGGGGSNAVNYMKLQGIRGVDFIVCNTDAQALAHSPVETKIQLGADLTEGLGAGANPSIGEKAALESYEVIQAALQSQTKMVFITAGMGGGTGTGAAPVIAKAARELGILTVGIVTAPFAFEGGLRQRQAETGVDKLKENVDSLIVINNNKLREVYGNLGFKAGFNKADEVLATAAKGIAEVITHHYNVNIDLRDARTVLHNSGTAIMGSAKASGPDRAMTAVQDALDSPLLNDNHIHGARHVLLLIVSGSGHHEITFDEIGEINDFIQDQAGRQVDIIMGIGEDEQLGDAVQVTVIATGFSASNPVGAIAPAVPETIVYDLDEDKPLNAVPKAPSSKTANGPTVQIDLFDAIENLPLPEDPKSANRPISTGLPIAEQPLDPVHPVATSQPVVHQLEDLEAYDPASDAVVAGTDDSNHSETDSIAPSSELSQAGNTHFEETAAWDHTDDDAPEDDVAAYESPAFDMSHTVEWDFVQPLSGESTDEAEERSFFALDEEGVEDRPSFRWDTEDSFDAFNLDAHPEAIIPEIPGPLVPELATIEDHPSATLSPGENPGELNGVLETMVKNSDQETTDIHQASEEPFYEIDVRLDTEEVGSQIELGVPTESAATSGTENLPERREVSTFNLEDLRALEASLSEAPEAAVQVGAPTSQGRILDPETALPTAHPEGSATDSDQPLGRDESGFELKIVQQAPRGPVSLDPENDPISREQLQRLVSERRAYLQHYNHSFQNTVQTLVSEQEWDSPSFERKGIDVAPKAYSKESSLGQTGISGEKKDIEFRAHNSFLHDNVD